VGIYPALAVFCGHFTGEAAFLSVYTLRFISALSLFHFFVIFYLFIAYPLPWVVAAIAALSFAGFAIRNELGLVEKNLPPSWEY